MSIIGNPVGALQEKCVAQKLPMPIYKDMGKQGPDHTPMFTYRVTIKDLVAEGMAGSKQKAKSKAAEKMLLLLVDYERSSSFNGQGKKHKKSANYPKFCLYSRIFHSHFGILI